MAFYLNINNIYNTVKTYLNIINQFLAHYIPILLNIKSMEIKKRIYNFKFQFYNFISTVFFGN